MFDIVEPVTEWGIPENSHFQSSAHIVFTSFLLAAFWILSTFRSCKRPSCCSGVANQSVSPRSILLSLGAVRERQLRSWLLTVCIIVASAINLAYSVPIVGTGGREHLCFHESGENCRSWIIQRQNLNCLFCQCGTSGLEGKRKVPIRTAWNISANGALEKRERRGQKRLLLTRNAANVCILYSWYFCPLFAWVAMTQKCLSNIDQPQWVHDKLWAEIGVSVGPFEDIGCCKGVPSKPCLPEHSILDWKRFACLYVEQKRMFCLWLPCFFEQLKRTFENFEGCLNSCRQNLLWERLKKCWRMLGKCLNNPLQKHKKLEK